MLCDEKWWEVQALHITGKSVSFDSQRFCEEARNINHSKKLKVNSDKTTTTKTQTNRLDSPFAISYPISYSISCLISYLIALNYQVLMCGAGVMVAQHSRFAADVHSL